MSPIYIESNNQAFNILAEVEALQSAFYQLTVDQYIYSDSGRTDWPLTDIEQLQFWNIRSDDDSHN